MSIIPLTCGCVHDTGTDVLDMTRDCVLARAASRGAPVVRDLAMTYWMGFVRAELDHRAWKQVVWALRPVQDLQDLTFAGVI